MLHEAEKYEEEGKMAKHIKHIVFWRMKETANGNDAETNMKIAIERLDAVAAEFPKLLSLTHHKGIFTGAHYFEEGRPLRIILQRTWKFSML